MAALCKIQAEAGCHIGFHGIPLFDAILDDPDPFQTALAGFILARHGNLATDQFLCTLMHFDAALC